MSDTSLRTNNPQAPREHDSSPAELVSSPSAAEHLEGTSPLAEPAEPAAPSSEFAHSELQPLDPRIIAAERVSNWLFIGLVTVGGLLGQAVYLAIDWPPGILSAGIAVAYVLVLAFLIWAGHFYPVLAYRHAAWRLSDRGLEIHRGVWWRHETTVPRARVQHTDVHQGPLMRKFGLARLVINTAGTQNASVALDGLSVETAQRLRSELVADCNPRIARGEPR